MIKLFLQLTLVFMIISACQSVNPTTEIQVDPTPTPGGRPKQTSATTLPLVERWRKSSILSGSSQYPANVAVAKDRVIIADNDGQGSRVMVFDALTGNLVWQSEYINHLETLAALDDRVYVGTIHNVQAFDLESGRILWKGAEQPWDKRGFLYVYPTKEEIHVYDFGQNHLYLLDPQSGATLDKIEYTNIFFKQGDSFYAGCGYGFKTSCIGREGPQIRWTQQFEWLVYLWPIFTDDQVILNAGGRIHALESKTGTIIWQSEDEFVSSPVLQDNAVYAIRSDAAIVALDPNTGEEMGVVNMVPNRTIEDDGGYLLEYSISASEKFVVVYYGNSREFIVFERTP